RLHWWLACARDLDAWQPRPGEVLGPRRVIEGGVDLGGVLVRAAAPDLAAQQFDVLVRCDPVPDRRMVRLVPAVGIGDENAPKALAAKRLADVAQEGGARLHRTL